jgi:hypothetical protein
MSRQWRLAVTFSCFFLALARTAWTAEPSRPANAIDFANTYAVIVGVLHWEDKGLTTYSTAIGSAPFDSQRARLR